MNILARASRVLCAASSATLAGSLALPGFPNDAARAGTAKQPLNYSGIAGGYHYGFIGEVTLRHLGASYFHPSTNSRRDGFSIEAFVEPSAGNLDLDLDDPDADEVRRELDTSEFAGIPVDSTKGVLLSDWADFDAQSLKWQENRFKIAWIIGNSPLKDCLDTKPVDLGRFQCYADELNRILKPESPYNSDKTDSALEYVGVATQAAIWRFTDGLILDRTALRDPDEIDEENDALMFAVYDYLVANAPEMTEPSFDQHTISGEVGTTLGPVTLTSPQIATITAALPDGFELLDGEGKPVGANRRIRHDVLSSRPRSRFRWREPHSHCNNSSQAPARPTVDFDVEWGIHDHDRPHHCDDLRDSHLHLDRTVGRQRWGQHLLATNGKRWR